MDEWNNRARGSIAVSTAISAAPPPFADLLGEKPVLPKLPRRPDPVHDPAEDARRQADWERRYAEAEEAREAHAVLMAERHKAQKGAAREDGKAVVKELERLIVGKVGGYNEWEQEIIAIGGGRREDYSFHDPLLKFNVREERIHVRLRTADKPATCRSKP